MKTIFIPISARQQARNVLRTDIFKMLVQSPAIRVILFAPHARCEEYKKELSSFNNVVFEGIAELPKYFSRTDQVFGRLSLFFINSPTGKALRKRWLLYDRYSPLSYVLARVLLTFFGSFRSARRLVRWIDGIVIRDNRFDAYFTAYEPDCVFVPRINSSLDRSFLRHAKKRKIQTIGMISAWDNITLSKYPFRILPDKLVAYNTLIKNEAVRYIDMPEHAIFVSGWPHFDFYITSRRSSRKEFCSKLNISPERRIILFASIGSTLNPTEAHIVSQLEQALKAGELPNDAVLIFRQHPTEKTNIDGIQTNEYIIVDDSKTVFEDKGFSEILTKDMRHLADSLHHAAVTVNTASTMSIDAAAFDKPIVNVAYDGWKEMPLEGSVRRFYEPSHDHYQPIVKSGGVRIARTQNELIEHISRYLEDPSLDREGRKRIVREQCYKLDGCSGKRIAQFILATLK